ncbi:MAG TPA: SdrD B-like domain-containing protein [Methanothrix sp.]|nr:SdrD B-like domain-containing protein [Methanothrix sp.]
MSKCMIVLLIILVTINIITTENAQAQPTLDSPTVSAASKSIASSENNGIKILGIDSTAFPKIKANILIDKLCAMSGNLKKDDFKVKEDDNDVAIDNVYFSGNASGQKIDLAIVFDETNSMDAKINALKLKVKDLTQKINSSRLDARYSLVTFNGADVTTRINWTNDADSFRNVVGKLTTSGGNTELPENSLDGIERALSFGFRPDAQKVILVVTDEPSQQKGDGKSSSAYTMDDVKSDLLNSSVMLIAVSPDFRKSNVDPNVPRSNLPKYADMRELGDEASGLWIDINSADFSTILKQIQGILTGTYVIEYTSPDQTPSENRTFFISADAPGCLKGSASGFYITPGSAPESQGALSISGRIFDDRNGDGVKGTDEAGLVGWDVLLEKPDGNLVTVKTDRKGYYIFTGLQPGSYELGAVVQGNWTTTVPEGIKTIDLVDTHESEIDFGFRLPPANQPPLVTVLMAEPESPQEVGAAIIWTVDASDPDGDQILYRFFLNDEPKTDWIEENKWTWTPNEPGSYQIEVHVRDGKHADPDGVDDSRSYKFEIIAPAVESWQKTFGGSMLDGAHSVRQTSDGGYIIAGGTGPIMATEANGNALLIKTDSSGNKIWDKTFSGQEAYSVQQTSDGGYIIGGITNYDGAYNDAYVTPLDAWLLKTDSSGNKLWDKTFGGSEINFASSVQQTNDGGYIIAGKRDKGAWLLKTDSSGNKLWDKTFGGSEFDHATLYSVQQTREGGYIIAGVTGSDTDDLNSHNYDYWMIKTDARGNKLWDRTFVSGSDHAKPSVQQTSDGGYIIACTAENNARLIKTDESGNQAWDKTFVGYGFYKSSVQQTNDGGYIIAGDTDSYGTGDIWLIKTDSSGDKIWDRTFGGSKSDIASEVQQTNDGGYIIAGTTFSYGAGDTDVLLIKTDANGNVVGANGVP